MTFSDLLNDISKLTGMELQSIRPGATITVLDVDTEKGCLLLKTNDQLVIHTEDILNVFALDRIHRCSPDTTDSIIQFFCGHISVVPLVDFDTENVVSNVFWCEGFSTVQQFEIFYCQTLVNMVSGNGIG